MGRKRRERRLAKNKTSAVSRRAMNLSKDKRPKKHTIDE